MTEKELRQKVCDRARAWLGCKEADGSFRPIIDRYNAITPLPGGYRMTYTDPWCAAFVSAVGADCGLTAILFPECSCDRMIARYQKAGRFEERDDAVPKPGDLIFYDWNDSGVGDCRGSADHVGLVASVTGNLLRIIEGNTSDAVGERSLHVDARFIRGYGQPDYASMATVGEGLAPPATTAPRDTAEPVGAGVLDGPQTTAEPSAGDPSAAPRSAQDDRLSLPLLRRGDTGETVRAAQLLLIGRGYRCGPWGADGEFGAATYGAIYRFQRARKLEADAIVGPRTWAALLGL